MINKAIVFWLILGFVACRTPGNKEESLSLALDQFNKAFAAGDSATLATMITEDYRHVNGNSRPYLRGEWLGYVADQGRKIVSGQLIVEDYRMDGVSVEMYGETAVVMGVVTNTGSEGGESFLKQFRVTHVWVLEAGQWKRVAFHDGRIE